MVIVGLVLSGIVALAMGKESQVWLRGISPTTFFIGTFNEIKTHHIRSSEDTPCLHPLTYELRSIDPATRSLGSMHDSRYSATAQRKRGLVL